LLKNLKGSPVGSTGKGAEDSSKVIVGGTTHRR
jgi:hypothetical protein